MSDDFQYEDVPSECGECRKALWAMGHWAKIPQQDIDKDRRVHDWPDLPLRRIIVCRDCFRNLKGRWQRFAGLDTSAWALVRRVEPDEVYGYCTTCGDKRYLRGGFCSQPCADR